MSRVKFFTLLAIMSAATAANDVIAADTAFEKLVPAQSSTIFVPSNISQVVGVRPNVKNGAFNLHETPTLWMIGDSNNSIAVIPDPPEIEFIDIEPAPIKKIKKAKYSKRPKIRKPVIHRALNNCVPEKEQVELPKLETPVAAPVEKAQVKTTKIINESERTIFDKNSKKKG